MRRGASVEALPGARGRSIGERRVPWAGGARLWRRLRHTRCSLAAVLSRLCSQHFALTSRRHHSAMEIKHCWWLLVGLVFLSVALAAAEGEVLEESDHEILLRSERGAKNRETCRYLRGAWSECDSKTNIRSRKLTLKKGDPASCESVKTIQKKCKKACRYEKSAWSECSPNGEMSRTDLLKPNSDPSCDQSRRITKKCNKNKQVKSSKDKGRRNRQ